MLLDGPAERRQASRSITIRLAALPGRRRSGSSAGRDDEGSTGGIEWTGGTEGMGGWYRASVLYDANALDARKLGHRGSPPGLAGSDVAIPAGKCGVIHRWRYAQYHEEDGGSSAQARGEASTPGAPRARPERTPPRTFMGAAQLLHKPRWLVERALMADSRQAHASTCEHMSRVEVM